MIIKGCQTISDRVKVQSVKNKTNVQSYNYCNLRLTNISQKKFSFVRITVYSQVYLFITLASIKPFV